MSSAREWDASAEASRPSKGTAGIWMALDALTVLCAAVAATTYEMGTDAVSGAAELWHGTLIQNRPPWTLLALLCGFAAGLIITSKRLNLYTPRRHSSILNEQRLSVQACLASGLLLTGALYLLHAQDVPRKLVVITVGLVCLGVSLRRLAHRILLNHRYERGIGTRNVLIVGTGAEANALRQHLESIPNLGYTFKGYIEVPGRGSHSETAQNIVGPFESLFQSARSLFVDEIFFTTPVERAVMQSVLEQARMHGVDLRVVPDLYGGLPWNPVEYVGQFPTIPLHCGHVPEIGLFFKRSFDVVFSILFLIMFAPLLLLIGIAVKLDSRGPALYRSQRIGKKGRVFRCIKFRTMVKDADQRRADVMHMNERDGVLFKISNDPRITRLGRFLRKYSLDELPQFINVLLGQMSIVGPRPPIASEVKEYKLSHLRRLDVTPGITGLWQVQGRQDPSFASYVSLDVTYIDNWSIWLDFKIMIRTVGVVFAGTGY